MIHALLLKKKNNTYEFLKEDYKLELAIVSDFVAFNVL